MAARYQPRQEWQSGAFLCDGTAVPIHYENAGATWPGWQNEMLQIPVDLAPVVLARSAFSSVPECRGPDEQWPYYAIPVMPKRESRCGVRQSTVHKHQAPASEVRRPHQGYYLFLALAFPVPPYYLV